MTKLNTEGLYKIKKKELDTCARILAQAFTEDPLMHHIIGSDTYYIFKLIVNTAYKHGHIYATGSNFEGLIAWFPPKKTKLTAFDFFTAGGINIILRYGFKTIRKLMKYEKFTEMLHNKHIKEPHWYLHALAVKDEYRKKGYSGKLIRPFLRYFDENNISCYLETNKGINVEIYKHYGFELMESSMIPETGINQNAMLRKPAATPNT